MALSAKWRMVLVLTMAMLSMGPAMCQEPAEKPKPKAAEEEFFDEFWANRRRQKATAAVEIVIAPTTLGKLALLGFAREFQVFSELDFVPTTAPPLNADWLPWIKDKTPIPDPKLYPDGKMPRDKMAFLLAYNQAVKNSFEIPLEKFIESAKDNDHVTAAHLLNQPDQWRGKIIPIKGRLIRLRKWESGVEAAKLGIPFMYEGWIMGPTKGYNPFWVVFPNLPDNLTPAEDMEREVEFDGYFLKTIKYPAADKERETALFVGPTLVVKGGPKKVDAVSPLTFPLTALIAVVSGLAVMAVLIFGFSWWFKRTDVLNRAQIQRIREGHKRALEEDLPWLRSDGSDSESEPDTDTDVMKSEEPTGEHPGPPKNLT